MSKARVADELAAIGRRFYDRDWVLGTSGNFSAVLSRRPLRLAITPSATHKGRLEARDFLTVDERGRATVRSGRPSAETLLHLAIIAETGAAVVLHTHSVWSTILSESHAREAGLVLTGFEMLKGLSGVATHEHREWIPILENDQDMQRLAEHVRQRIVGYPAAHAFLLRGHGLYTWGSTVAEAERHVEVLEFLLEAIGRRGSYGDRHHS